MSYEAAALSVDVGAALGVLALTPSSVDLFRYSAATNNTHKIHYDASYAAREGYPDILLQGHLRGAYASLLCTSWLNDRGELLAIEFTPRRYALVGQAISYSGRITAVETHGEKAVRIEVEIEERKQGEEDPSGWGRATLSVSVSVT